MAKLVIVESPAKAKTIGKYLGDDYEVTASMGHIRDLPASQLGIDVEHGYTPQYISIKGKEKLIKELKSKAKHADGVLLATDPDREGEAISWHLANILGLDPHEPNRVTFDEITKKGVKEGMAHPRAINIDLFNAQQARRELDRLVGYKLSPFLWKKVRRGLSAGRVQSVAVRLIRDREIEIENFKPDEYWNIDALLHPQGEKGEFTARLAATADGKKLTVTDKQQADAVLAALDGKDYTITKIEKGKRRRQPAPPFITSTLQQDASRAFGFSATRTMRAAQTLYEGVDIAGHGTVGLITYMRTDSLRIAAEAQAAAKTFIADRWGENYVCKTARKWKSRSATAAQDAHEAIRPSMHELTVLYRGKLTGLIVDPVSPEQKQRMRLAADAQKKPVKTVVKQAEPEKTKEEIYRQRAQEAEKERVARERYGPKKIIVTRNSQGTTDGATPKKAGQSGGPESRRTGQPSPAKVYGAGNGNAGRATGRQEPRMVENNGEYGDMPDAKTLMPAGHSRIDCAVRMVMKGKGYVDLLSSYGTLRITPLAVDLFRICFAKGQCREFPKAAVTAAGDLRCTVRENPSLVEITAGYAQIRVDKKTGALTFLNTQGKILLTERSREPRQLGEKKNWSFFEWKKDEALIAGGIGAPKPLKIGNSAAYFSYGRADDRYPGLASSKGYEMIFPAGSRVLCCNIAMYGTYISMEETDIIDYYLRAK